MTIESIKRFEEVQGQVAGPTENMIRVSTESVATLTTELAAIPRSMQLNEQMPMMFSCPAFWIQDLTKTST